jgi:hypothetical protein
MLEAAVRDGLHDLRLEEQVAEAGAVDADVGTLALAGAGSSDGKVALLVAVGGGRGAIGGGGGLDLLIGVVDQVLLAGRHADAWETGGSRWSRAAVA